MDDLLESSPQHRHSEQSAVGSASEVRPRQMVQNLFLHAHGVLPTQFFVENGIKSLGIELGFRLNHRGLSSNLLAISGVGTYLEIRCNVKYSGPSILLVRKR
jgi:hypothetical protein